MRPEINRRCRELLNLRLLCKLLVITQMFRLLAVLYYLLPVLIQNVYSQRRVEIYVQGCQLQAIGMPVFSLIQ